MIGKRNVGEVNNTFGFFEVLTDRVAYKCSNIALFCYTYEQYARGFKIFPLKTDSPPPSTASLGFCDDV